ncbi:ABC transporter substrate-binding protein [Amycolatopsis sp.]|uniref:ABC transporter substrate-binding protein n=1 Tax=Amycolatopsis sp. TaxID=37632 RepID=UPI0026181D1D|nr:ABC transporter substrate-binding protein [Amycolatopsis sp.]
MMTRLPKRTAIWGACLALLLTGCAATPPTTPPGTPPGTTAPAAHVAPRDIPAGMGSGVADSVFPRTVKHFAGSSTIAAAPAKVVVVSTGQADALLTLGIVPTGSTRGDGAELVPRYLINAFPQQRDALAKVADVGSRLSPSIEAIANLKPDLILMNITGKDNKTLYANLSKLAPTVATQGTGLYWKQDFLLVADAVGKTAQARQVLDKFQQDAAGLGGTTKSPLTVSFLRKNGDRLRMFGVESFTGSVADDAGLRRPQTQQFKGTSQDISSEQLDQADADWIFYAVQSGDAAKSMASAPLWPTLGAVAANHAVAVDDDVFYLNTGPTAARAVLTVLQQRLTGQG